MESMYKTTTDWGGELYIRIAIKWNHIKLTVELSISGYVEAALREFQNPKLSRPQESPYLWTSPTYVANSQLSPPPYTTPTLFPEKRTRLQILIGKFLYYCQAIDATMSVSLNKLSTHQNTVTEALTKSIKHLLNYCTTHTKATLE